MLDPDNEFEPFADWEPADDFEPDPDDLAWLDSHPILPPLSGGAPDDHDWDEFARYCEWQDHLEGLARITDEDVARVTRAG